MFLQNIINFFKSSSLWEQVAAGLIVAAIAGCVIVTVRHIRRHQKGKPEPSLRHHLSQSREETIVRARYLNYLETDVKNRLEASIHHARLLDINLEERTSSTLPWGYRVYAPSSEKMSLGRFADAFECFHRRLLLLGTPGCGKTTTLLHLATTLIAEARQDETAPIPLFFNLSSFRPPMPAEASNPLSMLASVLQLGREETAFEDWLVNQITALRGAAVPTHVARNWIEAGAVALLLDGLDEVAEHYVREVAASLNRTYFQLHPEMPVVVACRFVEYQPLEDSDNTRLWLEGGIVLQPLTDDQVLEYLDKTQARGLKDALPGDQVLMEMARTPLTLSMMVLAYGGLAPTQIQQDMPLLERRRHLLDVYVDRMMQRHARRKLGIPYDLNERHNQPTIYTRSLIDRALGWMAIRLSERSQTLFPLQDLHEFLIQKSKVVPPRFWSISTITACLMGTFLSLLFALTVSFYSGTSFQFFPLVAVATGASLVSNLVVWRLAFYRTDPFKTEHYGSHHRRGPTKPWPEQATILLSGTTVAVYAFWACGVILVSLSQQLFTGMTPVALGLAILAVPTVAGASFGPSTSWWCKVRRFVLSAVVGSAGAWATFRFGVTPDVPTAVAYGAVIAAVVAIRQAIKSGFSTPFVWFWLGAAFFVGLLAGLFAVGVWITGTLDAIEVVMIVGACLGGLVLATDRLARAAGFTFAIGAIIGFLLWGLEGSICLACCALLPYAFARSKLSGIVTSIRVFYATGRWAEVRLSNLLVHGLLCGRAVVPLRFRRFIDYCKEVMLLKDVPSGYEFMHRLLRDHFAIRDLIPRLSVSSGRAKLRIIEQLSLQGESSLDALSDLSSHNDPEVRAAAATGLGRVPSTQVPFLLMDILRKDTSGLVRSAAVEASRPLAEEAARPLLEVASGDADGVVRAAAIRAVGRRNAGDFLEILRAGFFDRDVRVIRDVLLLISDSWGLKLQVTKLIGIAESASDNSAAVVRELLERLHPFLYDAEPCVRETCAEILGLIARPESVSALQKAALDSNVLVRSKVVWALGKCGDASVLCHLISALRDPAAEVRGAAAGALRVICSTVLKASMPEEVVSALCVALKDRNYVVRNSAAQAFEACEAKSKLVNALVDACQKGNSVAARTFCSLKGLEDRLFVRCLPYVIDVLIDTRRKSLADKVTYSSDWIEGDFLEERHLLDASALNQLKREGVAPELLRWLRIANRWRRIRAARALGVLQLREAVPDLNQMLERGERWGSKAIHWLTGGIYTGLPVAAAEAIGQIGDESSVPLLESVARDQSRTLRLRAACIKALGQFRVVVVVEALARILEDVRIPVELAEECVSAIGNTKCIAGVEVLENVMLDRSQRLRLDAGVLKALGEIGGERASAIVCTAFKDASREPSVRNACVAALAQIGGPSAEGVLIETLRDAAAAKEIRDACVQALGKSGSSVAIETLSHFIQEDTTNEDLWMSCITALARTGKGETIQFLCQTITSRPDDIKLRWACEKAISQIPNPDAAKQLLDAISLVRRSKSRGV
jgi:HEAT repeat protein/DNA polymerase III delta prime subunit